MGVDIIRDKIRKLEAQAKHKGTGRIEAAAFQAKADALRRKHGIVSEPEPPGLITDLLMAMAEEQDRRYRARKPRGAVNEERITKEEAFNLTLKYGSRR